MKSPINQTLMASTWMLVANRVLSRKAIESVLLMGINPTTLSHYDFKHFRSTIQTNDAAPYFDGLRFEQVEQVRLNAISDYVTSPENYPCDESTFIRLFTQDIVSVGKDIVDGIASGQYVNTSVFKSEENICYPFIFRKLLSQFFTKNGATKDDIDLNRLAHIRTVFMMYYKLELPFSAEQQTEAFSEFMEIDNSVKLDAWPGTFDVVKRRFLSYLPDDPWDIRPRHGSGATNTLGVNNLHKTKIHRPFMFDQTPFRHLYRPSLFSRSTLVWDDNYKHAKITVVPKDSRGPRIISMEPHERMLNELGLMDKIVEFQENFCSGTAGYINYTDQTINQREAYRASISGARATLDLKNASDLVSLPLIMEIVKDTEWEHVFSILRSEFVLIENKKFRLKKFACMGNALCFPVMATLIRAILFDLDNDVLVYGDDIIIDSDVALEAMQLLHSYGLRVNEDKSFFQGPFRESCGGDFISGHNINYVKVKSFNPAKFIAFANNISDVLSNDLACLIIKNFEHVRNIQVFRSPSTFTREGDRISIPNVFNTAQASSNNVFFKRRYADDIQQVQYKIHAPQTCDLKTKSDPLLFGEDLLREWLYNALQYKSPLEEISQHEACKGLFHSQFLGFPDDSGEVLFQTDDKRQGLKWLSAETLGL